jgi:hypothetical protein
MRTFLAALLLCCFLALVATAQAAPSLTFAADRMKFNVNDQGNVTITYALPALDPLGIAPNVQTAYTAPAGYSIVSASGPFLIGNFATATWEGGGTATSNTVYFRCLGKSMPATPVGQTVVVPLGDVWQADSAAATVVVKRVN